MQYVLLGCWRPCGRLWCAPWANGSCCRMLFLSSFVPTRVPLPLSWKAWGSYVLLSPISLCQWIAKPPSVCRTKLLAIYIRLSSMKCENFGVKYVTCSPVHAGLSVAQSHRSSPVLPPFAVSACATTAGTASQQCAALSPVCLVNHPKPALRWFIFWSVFLWCSPHIT